MKLHRALEMRSAVIVYGLLGLIALASGWATLGQPFAVWLAPTNLRAMDWVLSMAIFGSFLVAYFVTTRLSESGADLRKAFQQILTPISYFQIFLLALVGGFIEEWFFRGILSSQLGIIVSAIFFGLAHLVPSRGTIQWGFLMLLLGAALGLLYSRTQSLLLVSAIHSGINLVLLFQLNQSAHQESANALGKY